MQYGPSDQIVRAQFEHGIRDRNGLQNLPSRHATDPIFWHDARAKLSSKARWPQRMIGLRVQSPQM